MQDNIFPKGYPLSFTKTRWNNMAPLYNHFDTCMQTFYYTLTNMLQLQNANNILQVACGTCKMIPYALSLKSQECTYLATDLSDNMVEHAKEFLNTYLKKLGVSLSLEQWMQKHKLEIKVHNGEQVIQGKPQFDRIICNLVLIHTEQPQLMLKSLYKVASKGCLLGATVWGDKSKSNVFPIVQKVFVQLGRNIGNHRSNFFLFDNLEQLAQATGWEVVLIWQQNAPFNFLSIEDPALKDFIFTQCGNDKQATSLLEKYFKQFLDEKKILNFPVQIAILRKT